MRREGRFALRADFEPQGDQPDAIVSLTAGVRDGTSHQALLERNDVLVVASVSCIYGLGSPARYFDMLVLLERGAETERDAMLRKLVDMQYERNDFDFHRGTFRVRGDVVEIFPAYEETKA